MKVKPCLHEAHQQSPAQRVENALEQLRKQGIRVTSPRKNILAVLARAHRPLSSEDVFSQLKVDGDLVTVYRSLTTLEEVGVLRRYELGDGVRRYELSLVKQEMGEAQHHHHYVRCRDCGDLEPFEGCEFEEKLAKILQKRGYRMVQHSLEVQALCATCQ